MEVGWGGEGHSLKSASLQGAANHVCRALLGLEVMTEAVLPGWGLEERAAGNSLIQRGSIYPTDEGLL